MNTKKLIILTVMVAVFAIIVTAGAWIDTLNFGLYAGNSGQQAKRDLVSSTEINLTVCASGCDYTTIQEAVNQVPYMIRHRFTIHVSDGTYAEDVWIPPILVADIIDTEEGSVVGFRLVGNESNINGVKLKSIHVTTALGSQTPTIRDLSVYGHEPTSDENVSIAIYGSQYVQLTRINMTAESGSVKVGILCYGSQVSLSDIYFNNNYDAGVSLKHGAIVHSLDGGLHGNVNGYVYQTVGGFAIVRNDTVMGTLGYNSIGSSSPTTGFVFRHTGTDDKKFYGVNGFDSYLRNVSFTGQNAEQALRVIRNTNDTERGETYVDDTNWIFKSIQDESNSGGYQFYLGHDVSSGEGFEILENDSTVLLEQEPGGVLKILPGAGALDTSSVTFSAGRTTVGYDGSDGYIASSANKDVKIKSGNYQLVSFDFRNFTQFGDGTVQHNITLTSPDASEWCCGVGNSGSFTCTAGACA